MGQAMAFGSRGGGDGLDRAFDDASLAADFRALFATATVGIAHVDVATRRFLSVNDAVCNMLGYDRAALLELTTDSVTHPDDVDLRDQLYRSVVDTGTATVEARLRTGSGRDIWVRVQSTLVTDADGMVRRTVNLLTDLTARRESERLIVEESERAHLALAAAQAGTWEYRYDPPEMIWSSEVFALYDRDPARGAPQEGEWAAMVHPDDVEEARRLGSVTETADQYAGAFRVRKRDGGWRWLASRARVIRDAAGKRARIVGINIDQTERLENETALTAAAARFRAAIDAMEGVLWTNDAAGRMMGEQPGWAKLTGQTRAEYEGFGWATAVHPDDSQPTIDAWNIAVASQNPFVFEHRVRRHDGAWRLFSIRAVPTFVAAGEISEWVGVHTDITDQRAADAALHDLNATLAERVGQATAERNAAWNNARDLMAVIGSDGIIRAANPAWTATLGWDIDEVVGRLHLDMNHPDDAPSSDAVLHDAQQAAVPNYECRVRHKDGGYRTISWLLASPDGEATFINGRDVTEERARASDLAAAQAQIHEMQKLESIGQLTGGVAHDFNNLLTPIIGSLDLLQRRGVGGEREARLIDGALTAADRAKTLVQRLLAFARRQQLQTRAVDLTALVDDMRDLIGRSIGPAITIVVDAHADLPPAQVDPAQLELALLNLALNARDAMEGDGQGGGGTLTIGLDAVMPGRETGLPQRRFVRLCVTDTGAGMDETTLRRAVEPFFSTKGIGKGTGLGLSMVHGLAAQSGGKLVIHSTPGEGTTATLWLPEADAAEPEDALPPAIEAALPAAEVILVVDDEDMVRVSTATMLADLGFAVIEAASAAEALALLNAGTAIDALVTDYLMPEVNGAELITAARALRPDLPALLVTGYADTDALDPGLARLGKPFRQAELAKAVAGVLG